MLCGLNGLYAFYNTPCTQYVSEGVRYLYYPEYNKCCNCCSAEDGCGVVIPTWLEGAEYLGTTEVMG